MSLPTLLTTPGIGGQVRVSNYYDRSATPKQQYFNNTLAPHGITQRSSYTVPTNTKAYIEYLSIFLMRISAGTVAGVTEVYFSSFTTADGTTAAAGYIATMDNTTIGKSIAQNGGNFGLLIAGDMLFLSDSDGTTGGTVKFVESFKVAEFAV